MLTNVACHFILAHCIQELRSSIYKTAHVQPVTIFFHILLRFELGHEMVSSTDVPAYFHTWCCCCLQYSTKLYSTYTQNCESLYLHDQVEICDFKDTTRCMGQSKFRNKTLTSFDKHKQSIHQSSRSLVWFWGTWTHDGGLQQLS